jgi:hypothetical protein
MRPQLLTLALLLVASPLACQVADSLRLRPGDLIRLAGPLPSDEGWVGGRVIGVTPYSFEFALTEAPGRTYSREYITIDTIDVGYRSSRESALGGGLLGLFVGTALGLVSGPFVSSGLSLDTGTAMALLGAGGGIAGGLVGALTGASIAPLRWHRYVFQPATRSAVPPTCARSAGCPLFGSPPNTSEFDLVGFLRPHPAEPIPNLDASE